jgi:hypothetical protein
MNARSCLTVTNWRPFIRCATNRPTTNHPPTKPNKLMNLSFSPKKTASEELTDQVYPFSPEQPASDPVTVQVHQGGSMISLTLGKPSDSTFLSGVNLDAEGTSIQSPLKVFICEDEQSAFMPKMKSFRFLHAGRISVTELNIGSKKERVQIKRDSPGRL